MQNIDEEAKFVNSDRSAAGNFISPPPSLIRNLIRYILGFSVSVAIGLAPYLGRLDVPLFDSLLKLIPTNIQDTALPLSAALMGLVAIIIQWYGGEKVNSQWLRKWFFRTLVIAGVSFLFLFFVHTLVVVKVQYLGGSDSETFLVGFMRPTRPPCPEEISDPECIKHLTSDPAAVESFWGSSQVRLAKIALILPYLGFMSSFALLVGLVMLRDRLLETQHGKTTETAL